MHYADWDIRLVGPALAAWAAAGLAVGATEPEPLLAVGGAGLAAVIAVGCVGAAIKRARHRRPPATARVSRERREQTRGAAIGGSEIAAMQVRRHRSVATARAGRERSEQTRGADFGGSEIAAARAGHHRSVDATRAGRAGRERGLAGQRRGGASGGATAALAVALVSLVLISLGAQTLAARSTPLARLAERPTFTSVGLRVDGLVRLEGTASWSGQPRFVVEGPARPCRPGEAVDTEVARADLDRARQTTAEDGWVCQDEGQTTWSVGFVSTAEPIALGDQLVVRALVTTAEPGSKAIVELRSAEVVAVNQPGGWRGAVYRLRSGLTERASTLGGDAVSLLPGMVVGDTAAMPADLKAAMRAASLTHLTAVSGAHIAIVLSVVLALTGLLGLPGLVRAGAGGATLVGFVALVGLSPSVSRAAAMGVVALGGLVAGRRRSALPALCLAVIGLVAVDPWMARSFGFALSVVATAALIVLAPVWTETLSRHMPSALAGAIAVPAAAQAACAPVLVLFSGQVSLVGVLANLLALPAVPLVTTLGLLGCLTGSWWSAAADVALRAAGMGVAWIAWVARRTAGIPGAVVVWPTGLAGALALGVIIVGLCLAARWALRHKRRARIVGAAALSAVIALTAWNGLDRLFGAASHRETNWAAVVCDIGQGTAVAIRTGQDSAVLVDTGPPDGGLDDCLNQLGLKRIDAIILTHLHMDHTGGIDQAVRGPPVGSILTPDPCGQAAAGRQVAAAATRVGVEVQVLASASGVVGTQLGNVQIEVYPSSLDSLCRFDSTDQTTNNASLAVHASSPDGLNLWVLGDLELAGQKALAGQLSDQAIAASGAGQRALPDRWSGQAAPAPGGVVVVAHHGSARQDPGLADLLHPSLAIISVGAHNPYGHPAASAVKMYEGIGARLLRTDLCGSILVARGQQPTPSQSCHDPGGR